jgi:ATP phosphoribosyltransferase regulatory subunit
MSRFEEYDLYVRNSNYMGKEDIVTFTDLNGKLLALKPDVTLSIIKNYKPARGRVSKVYYNENVYRPDKGTGEIKEIMQCGIECMGEVSSVEECEVIALSIKSLEAISENYILDISSVGIVSGLLSAADVKRDVKRNILRMLISKNTSGLCSVCEENGIGSAICDVMVKLCSISGKAAEKIKEVERLCINREMMDACSALKNIITELSQCGMGEKLNLDFSIIQDTDYYNGVVFRGYVDKLPESVLSGGRYDNLLRGMGKSGGAIGFAVYSDMLERIEESEKEYDCDVLAIYDEGVSFSQIQSAVSVLEKDGATVNVQKLVPEGVRAKRICRIEKGGQITDG